MTPEVAHVDRRRDAIEYLDSLKGKDTVLEVKIGDDRKEVGKSDGVVQSRGKPSLLLKVGLSGGVATKYIDLEEILDESFFSFVEAKHGKKSPAYLVPLSLLYLYRGQIEFAERHFDLARQAGITPTQWLDKLEWIRKNING